MRFSSLPDDPSVQFTERPYGYSASKAASDHLVRAWHEKLPGSADELLEQLRALSFSRKADSVVILREALAGDPIPVYMGTIRDWLYVEDHADALLLFQKGRSWR